MSPEIGTSSINWVQLSRFYLKMETESSLRNVVFYNINRTVFLDKDRMMDNIQKHSICSNVQSSQTFRSYELESGHYLVSDTITSFAWRTKKNCDKHQS
jgi:hypothetical protein